MRFVFFVHPHIGGTFTVYRHLRDRLAAAGINLIWVGRGAEARHAAAQPMWAAEGAHGFVVPETGGDEQAEARALVAAVGRRGFDGVFVNVGGDRIQTNAVRYLPARMLRILIVHNITPGIYASAAALRDHVHATVGVSRRITEDLIRRHGFSAERTVTILNAVDTAAPLRPRPPRPPGGLRLLSLGRVEDQAKGVFWLPEILARLPASVTLTVAGDGPDLPRLRHRCAGFGDRVAFLGAVAPERAAALLERHDILLAPSRFEGLPMTVIEAMAHGCVPAVSLIAGVTDDILGGGEECGLLFPVGDVGAAARAITGLCGDPARLDAMGRAAQATIRARFDTAAMGKGYLALIRRIAATPPPIRPPLDIEGWRMPRGLRRGLRSYLPVPIKNWLRGLRERAAI